MFSLTVVGELKLKPPVLIPSPSQVEFALYLEAALAKTATAAGLTPGVRELKIEFSCAVVNVRGPETGSPGIVPVYFNWPWPR